MLSKLDIHPVLIDIGASGGIPPIWEKIAPHSIYVGFEPDKRGMPQVEMNGFYKAIIIDEAVASQEGIDKLTFYLTKSPSCSSTLEPDSTALSNYLFSDLFEVEQQIMVRATTLNSVVDRFSLTSIDWLKVDSQGTDLRIFNSLKDELRSRVLAIDIEPGLIDAYIGEDLFVDAHRDLTRKGFWLSNLNIGGAIRMRKDTLAQVISANKDIDYSFVEKTVKKSPGWCESRYFRTIESVAQGNLTRRDYVLLWVFAHLDSQFGFALDLAVKYEKTFGGDYISQLMKDEALLGIKQSRRSMVFSLARSLTPAPLKRWLKRFIR